MVGIPSQNSDLSRYFASRQQLGCELGEVEKCHDGVFQQATSHREQVMRGWKLELKSILLRAVCLTSVALMIGCGPSYPATVAVSGVVTYQGAPVEGANVILGRGTRSVASGEIAIGKTDSNGRFELTSHFAGQASSSGAVPGDYEVTISKLVPPPGMSQAQYQAMVDAANKIGETGGMVPPGSEPPPLVEMLPPHYSATGKSRLKATIDPKGPNDLKFELD